MNCLALNQVVCYGPNYARFLTEFCESDSRVAAKVAGCVGRVVLPRGCVPLTMSGKLLVVKNSHSMISHVVPCIGAFESASVNPTNSAIP